MANTKEIVCIVCPSSCRLTVREEKGEIIVENAGCKRGIVHGTKEYTSPERMLTTTVKIEGGVHPRLAVIGTEEIPKRKMGECLDYLYALTVQAPIKRGDVIARNICDTGVDIIASRSMKTREVH